MSGEASQRSASRVPATLSTLAGVVLGGLAAVVVVRAMVDSWPEVRAAAADLSWNWLIAALVLAPLAAAAMGWGWRSVLRLVGFAVPTRQVLTWYFLGEIGKYLPGGIWPVLGRGELASRGGIPRARAYLSVALSLALLYLAAMCTALVFLPFALNAGAFTPWMLFLCALPGAVVLLHHDVLQRLIQFAGQLIHRPLQFEVPPWRRSMLVVLIYVPSWLLVGGATFAVARSFSSDASWPRLTFAAILSWIVGFLVVPVPSGAGVREAVLLATAGLPVGLAAATALTSRMIFMAVDAVAALVAGTAAVRHPSSVTTMLESPLIKIRSGGGRRLSR